jgi:Flp pilus assembly protein TadD
LKRDAGQHTAAIEDFRFAVFLNPNEDSWRYQLAVCLKDARQFDDARAELRRVVRRGKHTPSSELLLEWKILTHL